MEKFLRPALLAVLMLSLSGCGIFFPSKQMRAERNSPSFKQGYSDGCASATVQGTDYRNDMVRDDHMYATDRVYRAGWASGFQNCRTNSTHPVYGQQSSPVPDNEPGSHPY